MSVYANLVGAGVGDLESLKKTLNGFTPVHPLVAELLHGMPATSLTPAVAPAKITFWLEIGGMKCAVSPKEGEVCIFATISDPLTPWMCLEAAILGGKVDIRKRDKRTIAY